MIAAVVARRAGIVNMCMKTDNGRHEIACKKKEAQPAYTASWSWLR